MRRMPHSPGALLACILGLIACESAVDTDRPGDPIQDASARNAPTSAQGGAAADAAPGGRGGTSGTSGIGGRGGAFPPDGSTGGKAGDTTGGSFPGGSSTGGASTGGAATAGSGSDPSEWPTANDTSWNGSWTPADSDFPLAGLLDDKYFDGHQAHGQPTPVLPPGKWDWDESNSDLANWRNFEQNIGGFDPVKDSLGRHIGWRLRANNPVATDLSGAAMYFEGSSGPDWMNLGLHGSVHSYGDGNLGDGPDVLVFEEAWALDFRTGSSLVGSSRDDDLVVAGCVPNADPSFDVTATTIHTGPGRDWVFVRDMNASAIDLGNGNGGMTSNLDAADGDDLAVLRGNMRDFRVFGGRGNDTVVWYVDEGLLGNQEWLGPNFFGGGGADSALWSDPGIDRLVLAVPSDTVVVDQTPTPPGALMLRVPDDYSNDIAWDEPTRGDIYARYCITCGVGPGGEKTLTLEYRSANNTVFTGYFFVTAFEELQVGLGLEAKVYRLDSVQGKAIPDPSLTPTPIPSLPSAYCTPG